MNELQLAHRCHKTVTPAQAGVRDIVIILDSRFHWNDNRTGSLLKRILDHYNKTQQITYPETAE